MLRLLNPETAEERDRLIRRILIAEGSANLVVLAAKLIVGFVTGSMAVLGDAIHSLADVANNVVALVVVRIASAPPDREHPYGHRKFETLAVFGLAVLLTFLAFEIVMSAVRNAEREVVRQGWTLLIMVSVLLVNTLVALAQGHLATKLDSDILRADARHTLADVFTTVVVIAGWQFAAMGYGWLDTVFALAVALLVLVLAFDLFKRAIPILVDNIAAEPEAVTRALRSVDGIREVRRVRSRWTGSSPAVDVVISVDAKLPTDEAHQIADAIEAVLEEEFATSDVTVHIEPHAGGRKDRIEARAVEGGERDPSE